jgi:peptide/nickel transport system substrate-binding protein
VDVLDAHRIRFVLHRPWPDFLAVYATPATGAAWVVPRKCIEKVGEDAFKRQPVGLGPYRFVRSTPGVELVLDANEQYWRKKPSIKRVVIKGVPDRSTRLAMLKTGEVDIAEAERMGLSRLTGSMIPSTIDLATAIKPYPHDPTHARRPARRGRVPERLRRG